MQLQVVELLFREEKREILGESVYVSPYLLVEASGGHTVEVSKVRVENHALSPQEKNRSFDPLVGHQRLGFLTCHEKRL